MTDAIVKNLSFGNEARNKVFEGITKLTKAVSSTLGASGKCVMLEDGSGNPVITKDGVTVADSIILLDPIENMGARLLKEAARKTVKEAGDGTTTATILAHAILDEAHKVNDTVNLRELKAGIENALELVIDYIGNKAILAEGDMLDQIATISANNDPYLGKIIGDAFRAVGNTGVVMLEHSVLSDTEVEIVEGVQYDKGLVNAHFITSPEIKAAELDNPLVLIIESPITNIRQIRSVLEYAIEQKRSLLIIADLDQPVIAAIAMNKVKGNLKVNVINAPTYGVNKKDTIYDLALLTGATVINEDLGDDMDLIQPEHLGNCIKSITYDQETILKIEKQTEEVDNIILNIKQDISRAKKPNEVIRLEKRLARLSAKIAVVKVGANSDIELREKADRVEDAICATKAAIKDGIVAGGGIALKNAADHYAAKGLGLAENVLLKAIRAPHNTILSNAGIDHNDNIYDEGFGINVVTGELVNMVDAGIIDPLLVTKSALRNAVSVAITILSTDCVINNLRVDGSNR
jgi:chaperonin GroEL